MRLCFYAAFVCFSTMRSRWTPHFGLHVPCNCGSAKKRESNSKPFPRLFVKLKPFPRCIPRFGLLEAPFSGSTKNGLRVGEDEIVFAGSTSKIGRALCILLAKRGHTAWGPGGNTRLRGVLPLVSSLPEFMDFILFGKTILVVNKKLGLFWANQLRKRALWFQENSLLRLDSRFGAESWE